MRLNLNDLQHNRIAIGALIVALLLLALYLLSRPASYKYKPSESASEEASSTSATSTVIQESDSFADSSSAVYWLNSGGEAFLDGTSTIRTIHGNLPKGSYWQQNYQGYNSEDTDGGYHPQNLFRLFTQKTYSDGVYSAYARIDKLILSSSPNRNESNGLLLIFQSEDNDNLYYAGLRVDGHAVIKKKVGGEYFTLAEIPVFSYAAYDKDKMPNLLPLGVWIGIKADVKNLRQNKVDITLSMDIGGSGIWVPVLHAIDAPNLGGLRSLSSPGHAGFRSDFMDVTIRDLKVQSQ